MIAAGHSALFGQEWSDDWEQRLAALIERKRSGRRSPVRRGSVRNSSVRRSPVTPRRSTRANGRPRSEADWQEVPSAETGDGTDRADSRGTGDRSGDAEFPPSVARPLSPPDHSAPPPEIDPDDLDVDDWEVAT